MVSRPGGTGLGYQGLGIKAWVSRPGGTGPGYQGLGIKGLGVQG